MKAKKETTDRFPTWWLFYYVLRKAYFFLGIPFFLFCALGFTEMLCSDRYFGNKVEDYVVTFGSWFLLLAPGIWMYSRAKTRREKIRKVVQTIKESGFYSPEKGYEGLSLTQGAYFGIDLKNGTMLYVRIYPGNIMDVIGFDIHNFTRTVTDDKKLEFIRNTSTCQWFLFHHGVLIQKPHQTPCTLWQVEDMITLSTFLA